MFVTRTPLLRSAQGPLARKADKRFRLWQNGTEGLRGTPNLRDGFAAYKHPNIRTAERLSSKKRPPLYTPSPRNDLPPLRPQSGLSSGMLKGKALKQVSKGQRPLAAGGSVGFLRAKPLSGYPKGSALWPPEGPRRASRRHHKNAALPFGNAAFAYEIRTDRRSRRFRPRRCSWRRAPWAGRAWR